MRGTSTAEPVEPDPEEIPEESDQLDLLADFEDGDEREWGRRPSSRIEGRHAGILCFSPAVGLRRIERGTLALLSSRVMSASA